MNVYAFAIITYLINKELFILQMKKWKELANTTNTVTSCHFHATTPIHNTVICCLDCLQHLTKVPLQDVPPVQSIVTKAVTVIFLYQNHGNQPPPVVSCCSQNSTKNPLGT